MGGHEFGRHSRAGGRTGPGQAMERQPAGEAVFPAIKRNAIVGGRCCPSPKTNVVPEAFDWRTRATLPDSGANPNLFCSSPDG